MALPRFRQAKSADEEGELVESAMLKSSRNKNKWGYGIFEHWHKQRLNKLPNVEVTALFKDYDFHLAQSLDTYLIEMNAWSLNYWIKFDAKLACSSLSVNAADFLSGSNRVKICRDTH